MRRGLLLVAILCGACSLIVTRLTAAQAPTPYSIVGPEAAWNPAPETIAGIRSKCGAGDPAKISDCFYKEMQSAGASPEAVAFAKSFASRGIGWMRAFRETGRVDIAYVEYAFRANEMDGILLVNGIPPMLDVDDPKFLSQEDLKKSADYNALLQKYPNCSVWPGDRYHTDTPSPESSTKNGQDFKFKYILLNGCHACARIGEAIVSFHFDSDGHFQGTVVLAIRPGGAEDNDRPALQKRLDPIRSSNGKTFTINLEANHTTGYSWRLASPLNTAILKQVGNTYQEYGAGNMGAPGKEIWEFEGIGKGATEIVFEYVRPFEKDQPPAKKSHYWVIVEQ
jgi:predicted secreted protein